MRHRESTTGRLAMAGPLVLFVGIFAVCCGILTCVFFRGAQLSREAAQYNEAVMLCRSQAERLRAGEALPSTAALTAALPSAARRTRNICCQPQRSPGRAAFAGR